MEHALIATRGKSVEEVEACNHRVGRARDFLLHAALQSMIWRGLRVSPEDVRELRGEALEELRALCGACGLCKRFDMLPP